MAAQERAARAEDDDPLLRLSDELKQDLQRALLSAPAVLEAEYEEHPGPVDVPPEQASELLWKAVAVLVHHMPETTTAAAVAYGRAKLLEARVALLEQRVAELEG